MPRVPLPECLSLRPNGSPPPPLSQASVFPTPLEPEEEEQHSLAGEGVGGANSDDWKESLALCLLCAIS